MPRIREVRDEEKDCPWTQYRNRVYCSIKKIFTPVLTALIMLVVLFTAPFDVVYR